MNHFDKTFLYEFINDIIKSMPFNRLLELFLLNLFFILSLAKGNMRFCYILIEVPTTELAVDNISMMFLA
jgi:hypothetical protein